MSEVKKYRKLPVVIEAIIWNGDNIDEICYWMTGIQNVQNSTLYLTDKNEIIIPTLEGLMTASLGDYIIKGVQGEFYPCKPDIFAKTYEQVPNEQGDK